MSHVAGLVCTRCGREYEPDAVTGTCPEHDGAAAGVLDVDYDYEAAATELNLTGSIGSLWRYGPLLPVDGARERNGNDSPAPPTSLGAGGTPLLEAPTLSGELGVETLIKDETGNPTGSNKDRASAVLATRALEGGHEVITCASTGNAAASLAGYAARAGLDCAIFVPDDLPDAKAVQPLSYGATVFGVDGTYADAYDRCTAVSARRGWYNCSAGANPYAVEGKRTLGFEIAEETREDPPDWVALAMGNGCSLAGTWKGIREFERLGIVDRTPRMLGVQAEGASDIHDAFTREEGRDDGAGRADSGVRRGRDGGSGTAADSIDVRDPHNAGRACAALDGSGGAAVTVTDAGIRDAQRLLGASEGVFVEPASAAAVAGVRVARDRGIVDRGERVVVVATGTGLKDPAGARRAVDDPVQAGPDPSSIPPVEEW